eukprot:1140641-Pelagomonas_calceolata.AAC.3
MGHLCSRRGRTALVHMPESYIRSGSSKRVGPPGRWATCVARGEGPAWVQMLESYWKSGVGQPMVQ